MEYYVTIKNYEGKDVVVAVSEEVYQLFEEERRRKERERWEKRKHIDARSLDDSMLASQLSTEWLEEGYLQKEQFQMIQKVLSTCTIVQQKRFYYNKICGYNLTEIARIQGCGVERIRKSVAVVVKKIKIFLEEGGYTHPSLLSII